VCSCSELTHNPLINPVTQGALQCPATKVVFRVEHSHLKVLPRKPKHLPLICSIYPPTCCVDRCALCSSLTRDRHIQSRRKCPGHLIRARRPAKNLYEGRDRHSCYVLHTIHNINLSLRSNAEIRSSALYALSLSVINRKTTDVTLERTITSDTHTKKVT
jgi:hypothetical protein